MKKFGCVALTLFLLCAVLLPVFAGGIASAASASSTGLSRPASLEGKKITWVIGFGAGGGADLAARMLAPIIKEMYGLDVVVDNVVGGNGAVALSQILVNKSGTVVGNFQSSTFNSMSLGDFPYTVDDFTWICTLLGECHCVMVKADSPWKTPDDFFNAVKKGKPREYPVGIAGNTNGGETAMFELCNILNAKDVLIPISFPGASRSISELLGGNIAIAVCKINDAISQIKSGEVRPLFSISYKRLTGQDNLPAIAEFDIWGDRVPYADPSFMTAYLIGPKSMPDDVRKYLAECWKGALTSDAYAAITKDWAVRIKPVKTDNEVVEAAKANQAGFANMLHEFYQK